MNLISTVLESIESEDSNLFINFLDVCFSFESNRQKLKPSNYDSNRPWLSRNNNGALIADETHCLGPPRRPIVKP